MSKDKADKHVKHRARLRDSNGGVRFAMVSERLAQRLAGEKGDAAGLPVRVDQHGNVRGILRQSELQDVELNRGLERFRLPVEQLDFDPHIPQGWQEYLDDWRHPVRPLRILLYGPEGTGKDTLVNLFIQQLHQQYGEDNVALLTILPEKDDCYVGQLEVKARELVKVAELAKQAGKYVFIYFRELEGLFASGHHTPSWESRFKAELRDAIDGQTSLAADCIMATTNRLTLGPALISRFDKYAIRMDPHQAAAVLQKHWPRGETNGVNSRYVADRLSRESIAELTLVSRKTRVLRAPDITGLNGRFLSDLAAAVQQKVISKRRRDPGHQMDRALVDQVTRRHLESILAPVSEAVLRGDFATLSELFVEPIDRADPPVSLRPTLEGWCDHSEFLA